MNIMLNSHTLRVYDSTRGSVGLPKYSKVLSGSVALSNVLFNTKTHRNAKDMSGVIHMSFCYISAFRKHIFWYCLHGVAYTQLNAANVPTFVQSVQTPNKCYCMISYIYLYI